MQESTMRLNPIVVHSLLFTAMLGTAGPIAHAFQVFPPPLPPDTIVGPITVTRDDESDFRAEGTVTSTDQDINEGLSGTWLWVPDHVNPLTNWSFGIENIVDTWSMGADYWGAWKASLNIKGTHIRGPHYNDDPFNPLPERQDPPRWPIQFGKTREIAGHNLVNHQCGSHTHM